MMTAEQWATLLADMRDAGTRLSGLADRTVDALRTQALSERDSRRLNMAGIMLRGAQRDIEIAHALVNETTAVERHDNDWGV
jgi:hypothetical protein